MRRRSAPREYKVENVKGLSIETNKEKVSKMVTEFYSIL